ncbi:RpiB/LacA/LacB family sugar-phosphate isomerase [Spiroplasma culicicola]|uniref:Galactose-6-phosphate isomerase subunit LacA n=1 Tax=Spiroplasma culicicola AES-1 TaxID=1276246 RepID=W6AH58_9MOLU|nr:RpiB/LacA/LacB family sugar-phosphate isomerase [Spiroplasma culicicola]AHI53019.1 galactose-6-phosphate isomerase subunit LacA [Spiroplasma culicicola AES-1]
MEKVIIHINKNIDDVYKHYLLENIKNDNFDIIFEESKNEFSDYLQLVKKLQLKEISRVIVIDEFGSLPFMVIAKHKSIVVAQISDFHSARMTIQHNNSNVLSLGFKILAKESMVDIINSYFAAHFEAGRHMVRINMLENLLEGE